MEDLSAERHADSEAVLLLFGMGTRSPLRAGIETTCVTSGTEFAYILTVFWKL